MGLSAKKTIEQNISLLMRRFIAIVHQNTAERQLGAGGGGQRAQIGLGRPGRDHGIGRLLHRLTQQKLKASQLVSPRAKAGQIIPFNKDSGMVQLFFQIFHAHKRGWQRGQRYLRNSLQCIFQLLHTITLSFFGKQPAAASAYVNSNFCARFRG